MMEIIQHPNIEYMVGLAHATEVARLKPVPFSEGSCDPGLQYHRVVPYKARRPDTLWHIRDFCIDFNRKFHTNLFMCIIYVYIYFSLKSRKTVFVFLFVRIGDAPRAFPDSFGEHTCQKI